MEEVKPRIFGVLDAALQYFDECSSELTETAKWHIGKKSQDMQTELYEKKYQLEEYLAKLKGLEDEKKKVEWEYGKAQLKRNQLAYFNKEICKEVFKLQETVFEVETGNE